MKMKSHFNCSEQFKSLEIAQNKILRFITGTTKLSVEHSMCTVSNISPLKYEKSAGSLHKLLKFQINMLCGDYYMTYNTQQIATDFQLQNCVEISPTALFSLSF